MNRDLKFFALVLLLASSAVSAKDATSVFARMQNSVYLVRASNGTQVSQGSAVRIATSTVITNCHVVAEAKEITVRTKSTSHVATPLHSDFERDLCTLSLTDLPPSDIPVVRRLETVRVGEKVFALGAPRGLELSLSEGIVASIREGTVGRFIQTTAPISPGSSGGALFDTEARLVGITSFQRRDSQNLNFAAPAEWIFEVTKRHSTQAIGKSDQQTEANITRLVCKGRVKSNEPFKVAMKGASEWNETLELELDLTNSTIRLKDFYTALLRHRNQGLAMFAASQRPYPMIATGDTLSYGDGEQVAIGDSMRLISFGISLNRNTGELTLTDIESTMSVKQDKSSHIQTQGIYQCEKSAGRKF